MKRSHRASGSGFPLLLAAGIGIVLAAAGLTGFQFWRAEMQAGFERSRAGARVIAQFTDRLVSSQIAIHGAASYLARQSEPDAVGSLSFHRLLASADRSQSPMVLRIQVVGKDAQLLASSRHFPVPSANVGDRTYLEAMRRGQRVFIDRIRLSVTDEDALVISSPFRAHDVDGAIVSALSVPSVRSFLVTVADTSDAAASLMREDGKLLIRMTVSDPVILEPGPWQDAIDDGYEQFRAPAQTDGVERLYTTVRVGTLPLYASFGEPLSSVRAAWLEKMIPIWAFLTAAAGLFLVVGVGALRSARSGYELSLRDQELARTQALADQRDQLLRETHHRVKNNLALVGSLVAIQARKADGIDPGEIRARIQAIGDIHDMMYQQDGKGPVNLVETFRKVLQNAAIIPPERGLLVKTQFEEAIWVDSKLATVMSMVLIEIVTNAVKHAFPERRPGCISGGLSAGNSDMTIVIGDDGIGIAQAERASGLHISEALVAQGGGSLTLETEPEKGTAYTIILPRPEAEPPPE